MALQNISKLVQSDLPLKEIEQHLKKHHSIKLDRFVGSTSSFLIQALQKRGRKILAVYPEHESAQFLKSDLDALEVQNNLLFPPTNHKPYDSRQFLDSGAMVHRSEVLESISNNDSYTIITSSEALFDKIASPESFSKATLKLSKGDQWELEDLEANLLDQGYSRVSFVDNPGEFAQRGGIFDVFPFSGEYPVRLEFFGDEVDSIREFDPDSQRSIAYLDTTHLVPNVDQLDKEHKMDLFQYLDDDTIVVVFNLPLVYAELEKRYQAAGERYLELHDDEELDLLPPDDLFLTPEVFKQNMVNHPSVFMGGLLSQLKADWEFALDASPQPDFNSTIKLLKANIRDLSDKGYDVYILCDNEGQRDRFEDLLGEHDKKNRYHLSIETIHQGFLLHKQGIAIYTDHQIFNRYHRPNLKSQRKRGGISFKELRDLNVGDFVVHVDYGIGKFAGFTKIKVRDIEQEAVKLKYKADSVLYVNLTSLHKLQKYSGKDGTQPKLTKLGSGEWARKKAKTKKRLKDIARDLIELYAKRKAQKAFAYSKDNEWQTELEASFRYEETPDQISAIDAVKDDMQQPTPMDRLVCGDVGFGKTEVAVRAAFKAVMNNKQVALLVPTTILADQHYQTFKERMANFPVKVDVISRFRTKAEQKEILKKTAEGKIDILVGTHRITSKDIKFKDLGLLIVDEEQRFGVSAKEKLKEFRATVDVLTLTATPIPRTLHMSLMGARDLSIINTPPPNRQPVYTEIHSFDSNLIRDAIMQETTRGGQVFIIHNRVKNISEFADMIQKLVPNTRVRFAHGQMTGTQLEKIITQFYHHKFDVLVSTNIVENGLDISNANTIIINRADRFGLSELHQLRGRVGRSNRKAYCYLITPPLEDLSVEARKRLLALEEYSDLGSGFNIAMRDLDIRGAGDVLGAEQSGFINEIGFELYTKILNDAVKELKETEFKGLFDEVEVNVDHPETSVEFDLSALLPNNYVADNVERLNLYRKLAEAQEPEEIDDWKSEVTDRFGPLPNEGQNLIKAAFIKLYASRLFMTKVTIRAKKMWLMCPNSKTEDGVAFYEDGRFKNIVQNLQQNFKDKFKVVQKNDSVRLVIDDIPNLDAAITFLQELADKKEVANLA
ncbi:MAG TPA: transcription-repair coupling factor [Balneolales bacterium]|nr:transcription-repair coupling factor [Balneolales bacterium]